jgi:hypothetical protein
MSGKLAALSKNSNLIFPHRDEIGQSFASPELQQKCKWSFGNHALVFINYRNKMEDRGQKIECSSKRRNIETLAIREQ